MDVRRYIAEKKQAGLQLLYVPSQYGTVLNYLGGTEDKKGKEGMCFFLLIFIKKGGCEFTELEMESIPFYTLLIYMVEIFMFFFFTLPYVWKIVISPIMCTISKM